MSSFSASVRWLNRAPFSTSSLCSATNFSTAAVGNPSWLRPFTFTRRADSPFTPPARNRLRRDAEPLAHLVEGQHRLDGLLDRQRRQRPLDAADEQREVVPQVVAGEAAGPGARPSGTRSRGSRRTGTGTTYPARSRSAAAVRWRSGPADGAAGANRVCCSVSSFRVAFLNSVTGSSRPRAIGPLVAQLYLNAGALVSGGKMVSDSLWYSLEPVRGFRASFTSQEDTCYNQHFLTESPRRRDPRASRYCMRPTNWIHVHCRRFAQAAQFVSSPRTGQAVGRFSAVVALSRLRSGWQLSTSLANGLAIRLQLRCGAY